MPKSWTKIWLFRALSPTMTSSGEDFCFLQAAPPDEDNKRTAVIHNTCTVTVTHKLKTTQNHCLQFYHKVPGCVNLSPISCSLLRLHCTLKATLCEARGSTKWPAQEQSQQKGKAVWLRAWPSLNCWAGPSLTVPLGSGALLAARISHSHHWLLDP